MLLFFSDLGSRMAENANGPINAHLRSGIYTNKLV